jgi:hypothetical protein
MLRAVAFALACALPGLALPVAAQDAIACVRASCEPVASACIEAATADFEDCKMAVNRTCLAPGSTNQADCVTAGLRACVDARNPVRTACSETFRTCYAGCAPMPGPGPYFWCIGDLSRGQTGLFCEGDPANPTTVQPCMYALMAKGGTGGASCESL